MRGFIGLSLLFMLAVAGCNGDDDDMEPRDGGWHLDPAGIAFAEATIEVCDGAPSYIEENCASFGDRDCPWSAELVELRDCSEAGCPPVARAE